MNTPNQQIGLRTINKRRWEQQQREEEAERRRLNSAALRQVAAASGAQFLRERAEQMDGKEN